jgi:hypothetical protein
MWSQRKILRFPPGTKSRFSGRQARIPGTIHYLATWVAVAAAVAVAVAVTAAAVVVVVVVVVVIVLVIVAVVAVI